MKETLMTKEEFYNLINSKQPVNGAFTEDDIYEFGKALKELPRKDRSWEELADIIRWEGNYEGLRSFINRKLRKDGIVFNEPLKATHDELVDDDLISQRIQLEKEKQRVRDERTAYRRLLREDAREDEFRSAIRDTVSSLNKLPAFKFSGDKNIKGDGEAILMISDLHIGVKCDNYYNKYDVDIAKKRLERLTDEVIKYCKHNEVSILNVCNLGDMIHGIIHTNARIECEIDVINQVMIASEYIANVLNRLSSAIPKVVYRSVIDNHSRVIANKADALDSEHFSKLMDWYLEERLKSTSVVFANDNIDDGVGKFDLRDGKKVMFAHGHNDSINTVYQNFTGMTKSYLDYILLGHYHSPKAKSFQDTRVFVNGSIVGTEQYAFSKRLFSSPSQTLLITNGNNLIDITIDLNI